MSDPEQWATFEEMGEDAVRTRLAENRYGPSTRPIVEEWLRRKDQERDVAVKREQISIARSTNAAVRDAADAARDAADEAKQAKTIAKIAIAIAAIATIISIIGIYSETIISIIGNFSAPPR